MCDLDTQENRRTEGGQSGRRCRNGGTLFRARIMMAYDIIASAVDEKRRLVIPASADLSLSPSASICHCRELRSEVGLPGVHVAQRPDGKSGGKYSCRLCHCQSQSGARSLARSGLLNQLRGDAHSVSLSAAETAKQITSVVLRRRRDESLNQNNDA